MRYIHLLLVLGVTASATTTTRSGPACRYTIQYPGKSSGTKTPFVTDHLDTSVIAQYLAEVQGFDQDIASGKFIISIGGVCNVGAEWDYYLYQVSKDTDINVSSSVQIAGIAHVPKEQAQILQSPKFLRLNIMIKNWIPGQSTLNTVSLARGQTDDKIRLIEGPARVLAESQIEATGETPDIFASLLDNKEPVVGQGFKFPVQYECIFKSDKESIKYSVKSTGNAYLVHSELSLDAWQTVGLAQSSTSCDFPIGESKTGEDEAINERRVYVKNTESAITTITWRQNNMDYWLTVVSKPLVASSTVDLSLYEVIGEVGN